MQNRTKVWAVGVCLLAVAISGNAQHGAGGGAAQGHGGGMMQPPGPEAVIVPTGGASLAMHDFGGRTVVEVRINGKGPYRFILSASQQTTLIDSELQKELQLPVAEGMQAAPSAGGHAPLLVNVRELQVGGVAVRGVLAAATPLANMYSGAGAPRGVIGISLFNGNLVTCDYLKKRVAIAKGKLDAADAQTVFDYTEQRPTVPVKVAGRNVRVPVDMSSAYGVMLPAGLASELPLEAPPASAGMMPTMSGEVPVTKATVKGPIEVGKYTLAGKEVVFSNASGTSASSRGNLGAEVLRHFVVTFDPWNKRVRLAQ